MSPRVGGRGQRDDLAGADRLAHLAERQIFGPEVMAPLRDAMRLVNRHEPDAGAAQQRDRVRLGQPLGRDVDQPQRAASHLAQNVLIVAEVVGRIQARRRDPVAPELRHLVAHQRDQGRHHHGEAFAHQRRQLVAQRLARPGRHHRQHVVPGKDRLQDVGLPRPEVGKAEGGVKDGFGGGE